MSELNTTGPPTQPHIHTPASPYLGVIGVAREDITPPVGIYARNWGAAQHDTAEGIHRPLTLTALTIRQADADPPLVLIAMDLGWWRRRADEWSVRGAIIEALGLDLARVMLNCSHTHAGPSLCPGDSHQPGGHLIEPYLEAVRHAAIRATERALESQVPAVLEWAYGRCGLARHRDLPDPAAPRLVCGFNPAQPADDTLLVGRVSLEGGQTLATLVNYACHPVTLAWGNRMISPDFVGALRETIERQTKGAPCLFLQGASGELAPRNSYAGEVEAADRNGRELAYSVLSALEEMLPPTTGLQFGGVVESGAPLAVWNAVPVAPSTELHAVQKWVDLELKPALVPMPELERRLKCCEDPVQAERLVRQLWTRRDLEDVRSGECGVRSDRPGVRSAECGVRSDRPGVRSDRPGVRSDDTAAGADGGKPGGTATDRRVTYMPAWIWQVGDALLVGHPNEAYSWLQTELRRRFPSRPVVVMNVTNGWFGYLPPADLYDADVYQVWQTAFARGGLERLLEAVASALPVGV